MKRLISLLLVMTMLLGCVAIAEEDEEIVLDDIEIETLTDEEMDTMSEEQLDEAISEMFMMDAKGDGSAAEDEPVIEIDPGVDPSKLDLNENLPDHVINILLMGIDTRDSSLDTGLKHNDVNMVLSVNTQTGDIKISSILRDCYLPIPGYKNNARLNVSYARGGGQLAMRTINRAFELNIQCYVTINFFGLASIIDAIGGVDVDMTKVEASAINTYLRKHPPAYDNTDGSARQQLKREAGVQHLDGVQAVMYARLREIDNDFARTARQRHLMELLLKQVLQDMSIDKLMNLISVCMPYVDTNLNANTMFQLARSVLAGDILTRAANGEELLAQHRIPMDKTYGYKDVNGASVISMGPNSMKKNITALHEFIYGEYIPAD